MPAKTKKKKPAKPVELTLKDLPEYIYGAPEFNTMRFRDNATTFLDIGDTAQPTEVEVGVYKLVGRAKVNSVITIAHLGVEK